VSCSDRKFVIFWTIYWKCVHYIWGNGKCCRYQIEARFLAQFQLQKIILKTPKAHQLGQNYTILRSPSTTDPAISASAGSPDSTTTVGSNVRKGDRVGFDDVC
jgi:hypothetical protein